MFWAPLFGRARSGAVIWALLFGHLVFWAPSFGRTRSGAFIWAHPFRRYCLGAELFGRGYFGRTRFYCLGAEIFGRGCFGSRHLGASIWGLCFGRRDFWARVSWVHAFGRNRLGEIVSALAQFFGRQKKTK